MEGEERDKAVGVRYDNDLGYTISAYTSSSVFGNVGGSMDPLFIRADFEGEVACQNIPVNLVSLPVSVSTADLTSSENFTTSGFSAPITVTAFEPNDVYQCPGGVSTSLNSKSTPLTCAWAIQWVIVNTTQVGLRCQQEWELTGLPSGSNAIMETEDTLKIRF